MEYCLKYMLGICNTSVIYFACLFYILILLYFIEYLVCCRYFFFRCLERVGVIAIIRNTISNMYKAYSVFRERLKLADGRILFCCVDRESGADKRFLLRRPRRSVFIERFRYQLRLSVCSINRD